MNSATLSKCFCVCSLSDSNSRSQSSTKTGEWDPATLNDVICMNITFFVRLLTLSFCLSARATFHVFHGVI